MRIRFSRLLSSLVYSANVVRCSIFEVNVGSLSKTCLPDGAALFNCVEISLFSIIAEHKGEKVSAAFVPIDCCCHNSHVISVVNAILKFE